MIQDDLIKSLALISKLVNNNKIDFLNEEEFKNTFNYFFTKLLVRSYKLGDYYQNNRVKTFYEYKMNHLNNESLDQYIVFDNESNCIEFKSLINETRGYQTKRNACKKDFLRLYKWIKNGNSQTNKVFKGYFIFYTKFNSSKKNNIVNNTFISNHFTPLINSNEISSITKVIFHRTITKVQCTINIYALEVY